MSAFLGLLCPLLFVALIVAAIVLALRAARRRREGLMAFAAQREWRYAGVDPALAHRFNGEPFGRGSSQSVGNLIQGRYEGRDFVAFDYTYVTGSGDNRSHHSYAVVAMHLGDGVQTPSLGVTPQGGFNRFFTQLTGSDQLIGNPPFDDAYLIRTESPDFARDVLDEAMCGLLLQFPPQRAWRFEGDSLLVFHAGSQAPQEIDYDLRVATTIIGHVPDSVWARLRGDH